MRWLAIVALQVAALAVLANRYADETPHFWTSWFQAPPCGLLEASEFVITSRNVVLPDSIVPAAIKVQDGKITGIAELHGAGSQTNLTQSAMLKFGLRTVLDYGDLMISPGLVDTHVHLNEPGREHWEGFKTGTKAAATGGTTTTILMPLNSLPAITTGDLLKKKIEASKDKLWVDVGFWGGLVPTNVNQSDVLQTLLDEGALGFKCFMSPSGIVDFGTVDEYDVRAALPYIKSQGVVLYVHAEKVDETKFKGDVRKHVNWMKSRPPSFEEIAIQSLANALEDDKSEAQPGFKVHIAHLSSATGVPIIENARKKGSPISVETCPHYLNFANEDVPDGDTRYKCAPPIRDAKNRKQLWKYLLQGKINTLASDHSPAPPDMKLFENGDFNSSWGGIAGLQYNLAAAWEGLKNEDEGARLLAKFWSEGPAKMANLEHRKGSIRVGLDADFVVWDPKKRADTSQDALQHKHKDSLYNDLPLFGHVAATFVRGQKVYEEGQLSSKSCGSTLLRGHL